MQKDESKEIYKKAKVAYDTVVSYSKKYPSNTHVEHMVKCRKEDLKLAETGDHPDQLDLNDDLTSLNRISVKNILQFYD
jgi:hypothetical protein